MEMVNNRYIGLLSSRTMSSVVPSVEFQQAKNSTPISSWNNLIPSPTSLKNLPSLSTFPVHNFIVSPDIDSLGSLAQSQHLFENELNGVSIEQKIELALELVKTHLVFTVNDEINSLKEEIYRLVMRKSQLENENTFLRLHASPETLSLLNSIREGKIKTSAFPDA